MSYGQENIVILHDCSPAEALLDLSKQEVLRLTYCQNAQAGPLKMVELYIWICHKTHFYRGLYITNKSEVRAMNETPMSSKDVLSAINATSFQPGTDLFEKLSAMNVDDLQRLHHLNKVAA